MDERDPRVDPRPGDVLLSGNGRAILIRAVTRSWVVYADANRNWQTRRGAAWKDIVRTATVLHRASEGASDDREG